MRTLMLQPATSTSASISTRYPSTTSAPTCSKVGRADFAEVAAVHAKDRLPVGHARQVHAGVKDLFHPCASGQGDRGQPEVATRAAGLPGGSSRPRR
jgi:hypothetical protein